MRRFLIGALFLLCAGMAVAKTQADTVRILAIGNSFSQDAIEQNLYELAREAGIPVIIGNAYIGGCSIERHVMNSRTDKAEYAYRKIGKGGSGIKKEYRDRTLAQIIADEQWDYVSLQQASPFSGMYETYEKWLPELYSYVKARVPSDAKFMLHQTWAYAAGASHTGFRNYDNDQMKMYRAIVEANERAAKLIGVKIIVPSGTAIQNARTSFIGDNMNRDGYHLDLLWGRYTAACTWFEKLFGHVYGNAWAPQGLTPDYVEVAQFAAKEAVRHPDTVTEIDVEELPVVYRDASAPIDERVEDLLSRMTLAEKVYQLNQYVLGQNDNVNNIGETVSKYPGEIGSLIYFGENASLRNAMQKEAMENTRLGIPILFGFDVIHGFRTVYPIPLAQAASWNPVLAGKAARVAATEAYSAGIDWTFSPMVDIARDPRWGRMAEGYGEDPFLCSEFSSATVKAYQGDDLSAENNIAACLKHYVGYGASEAGRDYVPTEISRQTLWDTYLPSFKAGVEAGAVTLMSSFNNISGTPGSANHYTMTEVLKEKWSHDGFVVADWNAVDQLINQGLASDRKEAAMYAFNAGLDMDMVDDCYQQHLAELVSEGKVTMDRVDDAVRRVLKVKFMLGLFDRPYTEEKPESEWSLLPESLETVEQLAQETMVLLKNDSGVLPLKPDVSRIALIGPMAKTQEHLLGSWSGKGRAEDVTSIYAGLAGILPQTQLIYAQGCGFDGDDMSGFAEAVAAADSADIVILCLGEKRNWSGENASRSTVALPLIQEKLLEAVKTVGKPVVVLLSNGRALDLTRIAPVADAVLEIWQPGVRAGQAVAGILTGKYNPSGKLPVTFPYTTGQIPIYYNHRNSGRRGTQGLYQDIQSTPMYEFGYGLSYTDFEYGPLTVSVMEADDAGAGVSSSASPEAASSSISLSGTVSSESSSSGAASFVTSSDGTGEDNVLHFTREQKLTATVTVTNTGDRDGKEVVQWYICDPYSSITRPVKELKHFEKQLIKAGESRIFTFEIDPVRDLGFVDSEGNPFLEAGDYYIIVNNQKVRLHLD